MPNRIIKESLCTSEDYNSLSMQARDLFLRLIVCADDFGLFDGRIAIIKGRAFPLENCNMDDIEKWLSEIENQGMIIRYSVERKPYIMLTSWNNHQQIRAKKPKYPHPISNDININQQISNDIKCSRNPIQSESNPYPNPMLSDADADDLADGLNAVFDKARYVGFKCTQQELDALNLMVADYGKDAVLLALNKAGEASAPKIGYLKGIFKNDITGGTKPKEAKDERSPAKRLQDARSRLIAQGKYKEADKLTLHDLEGV